MLELSQLFTDREKDQLDKFAKNELLSEAVKKVILSSVYFDGTIKKGGLPDPLTNFALALASMGQQIDDKELGSQLRSSLAGVQLLEQGFQKIQLFNRKEKKPEEKVGNPGR